jgi:hypothetical protein
MICGQEPGNPALDNPAFHEQIEVKSQVFQ